MKEAVPVVEEPGRSKILVVDDEPRIRDACRMVLSEEGFEVALAADGQEGVQMIREEHFDVILVDLMMPVLSGFEVLSYVRDSHPDTVVIVITGYATLEHSINAMKRGAFDFIPKPFTPDQLRAVVAKAIRYNRALQDIADTNSRLKTMVNRLTDGVMASDRDKKVVLANPAFLHLIDYHGEPVLGRVVTDLDLGEQLVAMIDQALVMPDDTFTELTAEITRTGEGGERIVRATCVPFRGRSGVNIGTITVLNDITALKEFDRIRSDFVSMVCHEVRSPMNSMMMQLKVVLDGLAGELSGKQREILKRVSEKMLGLTAMVSELLDLSRLESGLIASEKSAVNMAQLFREQIAFHEANAARKAIILTLDMPEALPPVLANQRSMEEVLTNLITNAIKYSPEGSAVRLEARVENEYLRFSLQDNGYGIPEEDLKRIFDRFYRVNDENTRAIVGTGLGLAIVKSIVDAHHGSIKVASKSGAGSTFTVLLPLAAI
jgi:two-component system, OmpR family, phosphate regulon sensor histidine kinase PhoR